MNVHVSKRAGLWSLGLTMALVLGCGGGRMTAGEFCSSLGGAVCGRMVECDSQVNMGMCTSEFQASCCGDSGDCGEEAPSDEEEMAAKAIVDACSMAIDEYDCTQLAAGNAPFECLGGAVASGALTAVPQGRLARDLSPARISGARQSLDPRVLGRQAGLRLLSR